ncbi:MAG TPA: hypothetical protein VFQ26_07285 [Nitrospiraceae bacterium]|nr:hypothetical protein [Nitrospiraceae bacterium]
MISAWGVDHGEVSKAMKPPDIFAAGFGGGKQGLAAAVAKPKKLAPLKHGGVAPSKKLDKVWRSDPGHYAGGRYS